MWREIYTYALNPEVFFDSDNLKIAIGFDSPALDVMDIAVRMDKLRRSSAVRWSALAARLTIDQRHTAAVFIMQQSAPMASVIGATVHNLSAPGVFEAPHHLRAMALLADDIGAGAAQRARADAFRAIAWVHSVNIAAMLPHQLSLEKQINDQMFRLPGALLAMSRRSDQFKTELIGADLALRELGLFGAWAFAADELDAADWARLDLSVAQMPTNMPEGASPLDISRMLAQAEMVIPSQKARLDIATGFVLDLYAHWDQMLYDLTIAHLDSMLSMALLLQAKAREASVYHGDFKLEGRPLREWFLDAQSNPLVLLSALSDSRVIRKGAPERSRLVTQFLAYGGPMFRVFNYREIAIMRRWITELGRTDKWFLPESRTDVIARLSDAFVSPRSKIRAGDTKLGVTPRDLRQAYFVLQGRSLAPATRHFAIEYCDFWIGKAAQCVDKTERSLPQHWQPTLLREWLLQSHAQHAERFEESVETAIPSREAVIEQSLQLAPLTLIDGAWLQGYCDSTLAASPVGAPLFNTYWDELGNGEIEMNHPKVYRDVLCAMGHQLPPTNDIAFAKYPALRDESFRLPVFWLAIGKFPLRYQAEVLGLNLAMELSGVGGTYRSARRFLLHYDFPTIFVDLHNTIDNVSDGHAAWAVDAIDHFISSFADVSAAARAWTRVRNGFEALDPIADICGDLDFFPASHQAGSVISPQEALHHAP